MKIFDVIDISELPEVCGLINPQNPCILNWRALPESVWLKNNNPFFVPSFPGGISAYPALAVKVCKLGKGIPKRFAHRYYKEAAAAVIFKADKFGEQLRSLGLSDAPAFCFDKAIVTGDFAPTVNFGELSGKPVIIDSCLSPIFDSESGGDKISIELPDATNSIDIAIELLSRDNTIKIGDLILLEGSCSSQNNIRVFMDSRLNVSARLSEDLTAGLTVTIK